MRTQDLSLHIRSPKRNHMKYFAYGSNLSTQQMRDRGVTYSKNRCAVLKGWKLIFPIHSRRWNGGAADIKVAGNDDLVEGVIYEIDEKGLRQLDHYEDRRIQDDIEVGTYRRQYIWVESEEGIEKVLTYIVNRSVEYKEKSHYPPSVKYRDTIMKGAETHGLRVDYIRWLKSIPTRP